MGNHNTQYFQTILLNNQSELKFMLREKNVSEKAVICYTFTSDWVRKSPKNFQSVPAIRLLPKALTKTAYELIIITIPFFTLNSIYSTKTIRAEQICD